MLSIGVIHTLTWVDTCDMIADALTKGLPDRSPLLNAMLGHLTIKQPTQSSTRLTSPSQLSVSAPPLTCCHRSLIDVGQDDSLLVQFLRP